VQENPAQEVHEHIESFAAEFRERRDRELSAIGARFSDRAERLGEAISAQTDAEELRGVLEKAPSFGPTDAIVVAALWEKYGEPILRAAAELGLNPKTVAEELASTLGPEHVPTAVGLFIFNLEERA
jgi:hypothetical protein